MRQHGFCGAANENLGSKWRQEFILWNGVQGVHVCTTRASSD